MSTSVANEIYTVFDARRVKAPELKNIDHGVNWVVGYVKNRMPVLGSLKRRAVAVERLEKEVHALGSAAFREKVLEHKDLGRVGRLKDASLDYAFALAREATWRARQQKALPRADHGRDGDE